MKNRCIHLCALAALFAARSATAAPPPPATSLNACQNAVKVATATFVKNKVAAIGACLQAVSTQIVKNNAGVPSGAASSCVTQFRKINDTRGLDKQLSDKLAAAISAKCTPGGTKTHTLADIIGAGAGVPQPLKAQNLNAWCANFGGDGSIDTLQEWIDCLTATAECDVDSTIASQYPRAIEWLNLVKPSMQALSPPGTDPTKITDAVAGLDAVKAEIDGSDNDNVASIQCGAPVTRFEQKVVGTDAMVVDHKTGLEWVKTRNLDDDTPTPEDLVDADNVYRWSTGAPDYLPDGNAFTTYIAGLNAMNGGSGYGGHNDWRLPTSAGCCGFAVMGPAELESIVDLAAPGCGSGSPCIDQSVFGPTQSGSYWSTSIYAPVTFYAWHVNFVTGLATVGVKAGFYYVRAVRSGL